MRLLRRNALGVYGVYAAAIVSGLVVTPVVIHSIGKTSFGVWTFIGAITIYLSLLDFGVGPSIVRFGAEARGRRATTELDVIASTGLAIYAAIGVVTLPVGLVLAWIVPWAAHAPEDLVWDARVATFLVVLSLVARFPLGLFNNLLVAHQRWDLQNLANFTSTVMYALLVVLLVPRFGGLVLLGALTLVTTVFRLSLPLLWLKRELPGLRVRRASVSRRHLHTLLTFSTSNFVVHVTQKIVFSADVIVVGIVLGATATGSYGVAAKLFALAFGIGTAVTSLMFPAFAELEGAGAMDRQRSLLLSGLRIGTALMLMLALPLLFIPDLLIRAWIGGGYQASYTVTAILAGVLLIHQPIYVLTQFLIARARQRAVALVSLAATIANVVLSFLLAWVWGTWGVAASTLFTDLVVIAYIVPRVAAPAADATTATLVRAIMRPVIPALVVAAVVLVGLARTWKPDTLFTLALLGLIWTVPAAFAIWRFGFDDQQRSRVQRELLRRPQRAAAVIDA